MLANLRVSSVLFKQNKGSIDVGTQQNKKKTSIFVKQNLKINFELWANLRWLVVKKIKVLMDYLISLGWSDSLEFVVVVSCSSNKTAVKCRGPKLGSDRERLFCGSLPCLSVRTLRLRADRPNQRCKKLPWLLRLPPVCESLAVNTLLPRRWAGGGNPNSLPIVELLAPPAVVNANFERGRLSVD